MASYKYDAYAAQQEARRSANPNGGQGPEVHFLNDYLKEDGDVAVVRFPYHSMEDLVFETTHSITFPAKKYPSRVRCIGDGCPFCTQGIKLDTRFFAKALVYAVDETSGEVGLINAVWDRPAAFADIDIKNLMQEYGDISNFLFKIKRNGSGTATRYTISIVMNNTVYNPAVYKADFTELDKVDPVRILTKTLAQYNEALNPTAATQTKSAPAVGVSTQQEKTQPVGNVSHEPATNQQTQAAPKTTTTEAPGNVQVTVPTAGGAEAQKPETARRPTTKYQF